MRRARRWLGSREKQAASRGFHAPGLLGDGVGAEYIEYVTEYLLPAAAEEPVLESILPVCGPGGQKYTATCNQMSPGPKKHPAEGGPLFPCHVDRCVHTNIVWEGIGMDK